MATMQIRGNTQIKSGTITTTQISSTAGIQFTKLEALTNGNIIVGNGSNQAAQVTPSGDITLSNAGVFGIASGAIVNADINGSAAIDTSKLADGANFLKKDGSVAMTADLNLNSNKITNLTNGSASGDAVNKGQLDAAVSVATAGLDYKASVRAATTANITLSGAQTIDGVSVIAGDRVLVKDQSTGSQNGIYVAASGAWSRSTDADADAEVTAGMFCLVEEGTANADSAWVLAVDGTIVVGTTALTFNKFLTLADLTAGAGLTKSGNTINAVSGNGGIVVNADDITLTVDATADSLSVGSSGIKIKNGTSGDIYVANGSGVFTRVAVSGDITLSNAGVAAIASGVIVNADINASAAIALSKLASGSSAQVPVCNGSGVPTYVDITGDVTISNAGVTAIASGVIVNADINASAAIALSKLASGSSAQIIVCNGSGVPTYVALSGDATIDNTGALTITGAITSSSFVFNEVPTGTINGSNDTFTLANTPITGKVTVYLNGLLLKPTDDYSISTATITMVAAPETGDVLIANYLK